MIGVPREGPRPKPKWPEASRVFGRGTSQGTPFTMIPQRLFHIMSFMLHPGLVKRDFIQTMDGLGSIMVNVCPSLDKHRKSLIPIYISGI